MKTHWRLPRGVDELLPPVGWQLELLRRRVLDVFHEWGFEYVEPPIIEYLESLLVASGEDLDLQTLKVVDQVSGKQLGVRADMTSQAVRIDAHSLITDEVQRLCYAGPVVFANPQIAQASRVPYKAGAEIFGAATLDADEEVVELMLAVMSRAEIEQPVLLLGHMGIYRSLVRALLAKGLLDPQDEPRLFKRIQRKSAADILALLKKPNSDPDSEKDLDNQDEPLIDMLAALPNMMGSVADLDAVAQALQLQEAPDDVATAFAELRELAERISRQHKDVSVRVDVSELSGYGYHNGPVFAVYHPQHGSALAQGGRYDGVGEAFGRPRPATGFDVNLKMLLAEQDQSEHIVFAPFLEALQAEQRLGLREAIEALRANGTRVRVALSGDEAVPTQCTKILNFVDDRWEVADAP